MPKTRTQKSKEVQELVDKIKNAKIAFFTTQSGIDVKTIQQLRQDLKKENIEFIASKKTLLNLALKESGITDLDLSDFEGIVGTVFGYDDEVTSPNLIYKFSKAHENLQIQAGILEGQGIQKEIVINLAKLPSKQELQGKFVNVINSPISGFANVLAANIRGFVQVLNQIKEKQVS